jgi:hypothetical protein
MEAAEAARPVRPEAQELGRLGQRPDATLREVLVEEDRSVEELEAVPREPTGVGGVWTGEGRRQQRHPERQIDERQVLAGGEREARTGRSLPDRRRVEHQLSLMAAVEVAVGRQVADEARMPGGESEVGETPVVARATTHAQLEGQPLGVAARAEAGRKVGEGNGSERLSGDPQAARHRRAQVFVRVAPVDGQPELLGADLDGDERARGGRCGPERDVESEDRPLGQGRGNRALHGGHGLDRLLPAAVVAVEGGARGVERGCRGGQVEERSRNRRRFDEPAPTGTDGRPLHRLDRRDREEVDVLRGRRDPDEVAGRQLTRPRDRERHARGGRSLDGEGGRFECSRDAEPVRPAPLGPRAQDGGLQPARAGLDQSRNVEAVVFGCAGDTNDPATLAAVAEERPHRRSQACPGG